MEGGVDGACTPAEAFQQSCTTTPLPHRRSFVNRGEWKEGLGDEVD